MKRVVVASSILFALVDPAHTLADGGVAAAQNYFSLHPGARAMLSGDEVTFYYGGPTENTSNVAAASFVEAFLLNNATALAVDYSTLVLRDALPIANGSHTVYTYTQRIGGVPVLGGMVKVIVGVATPEHPERIGSIVAHRVTPTTPAFPADVLTAAQAQNIIRNAHPYSGLTDFSAAEKVIYQGADGKWHRVWRFLASGDHEGYECFVDTNSGDVVAMLDSSLDASVNGTVSGYVRSCCPASDPGYPACCGADAALQEVALPGMLVRALAGDPTTCPSTACATSDGAEIDELFTDPAGAYAFGDVDLPVRVRARSEEGELANVVDCDGRNQYICPRDYGFGLLSGSSLCAQACQEGPTNLVFNPAPYSEVHTSIATVHHAVRATHDWFAALQPELTGINKSIVTFVNAALDNAKYQPWDEFLLFGIASTAVNPVHPYNNHACPSLISHEYGHFIQDQLGLGYSDIEQTAFQEGAADTVATLLWKTPYVAYGLFVGPSPAQAFFRRVDAPDVRLNDCASIALCVSPTPCQDPHCLGLALAGAFWDLRERLGSSLTERLFADFLMVTDGRLDSTVLAEVLTADQDNDDDITNGTMHSTDIIAAFVQHGWSPPSPPVDDGSVVVHWTGPPPGIEPSIQNGDYSVHFEFDPPHVTLHATQKGTVPINIWRVGRTKDGVPAEIGRVSAEWNGTAHNVIVQIGDSQVAASKCKSAQIVDIPSQDAGNPTGPTTWTGLDLQLSDGDLLGRAQCYATADSLGGRVMGSVNGRAKLILAKSIGTGASLGGILDVDNEITQMAVDSIPPDSTVTTPLVHGELLVNGDLEGTLETRLIFSFFSGLRVGGVLSGHVSVADQYSLFPGSIRVGGDISGTVSITGTVRGEIIANVDGVDGGSILGPLTVSGTFNGNICGDNLSASQPLPPNIHFGSFGPNAKICGVANTCPPADIPAAVQQLPGGELRKNRYVSIVPGNAGKTVALRVRLKSLSAANASFAEFENSIRWVGQPEAVFIHFPHDPAIQILNFSPLRCEPYWHDWGSTGALHIAGAEIVPNAEYEVQAVSQSCGGLLAFETNYSTPVILHTAQWGDVRGMGSATVPPDGVVNFVDISATVAAFQGVAPPAAVDRSRAQLYGNFFELSDSLSFLDITSGVSAFLNQPYPFVGPCECPSSVSCGLNLWQLDQCGRCTP